VKPRVFVSSTHYDLKYLRSSLEALVESLGFDAILSEKSAITYDPDIHLDESCYRAASEADIFILIIGGRYGSPSSKPEAIGKHDFTTLYESITRGEYEAASRNAVPIYILIEASVYADFELFSLNPSAKRLKYPHADSVNIFHFIRSILEQSMNNPVCRFTTFADIETFLREQWAGLFREMLRRRLEQRQLSTLSAQILALSKLNETLKTYVEAVLHQLQPANSKQLIEREDAKLRDVEVFTDFVVDSRWHELSRLSERSLEELFSSIKEATTFANLMGLLFGNTGDSSSPGNRQLVENNAEWQKSVNGVRAKLTLPPFTG
jgi:hypothetical protein